MTRNTCLLGISAGFHDSSAALVSSNGQVIYAASEERFTRVKGDRSFPWNSIEYAIQFAENSGFQITNLLLHESPFERFNLNPGKSVFRYIKHLKNSFISLYDLSTNINNLKTRLHLDDRCIFVSDHHLSHAYAAVSSSNIENGLILVLDAIGGSHSGLIGQFRQGKIYDYEYIPTSKSLGLIYSSVTVYCGFKVLTGEYKLMGLAPYGKPIYYQQLVEVFGPPTFEDYTIGDLSIFASSLISKSYQKSYHFPLVYLIKYLLHTTMQIWLQVCNSISKIVFHP